MIDIAINLGLPFVACAVMFSMLSYIGIHVLKREVIFIDIALAQIAAVGAIAAHVIFHIHGHSILTNLLSFFATLVAAAFFAIVRRRISQIPLEAVIGVSYAVSAAAALFLVGVSPGGHLHIQEMLAGSILWANSGDILWSAVIFAAVSSCFYYFRRPFLAISDNYEKSVAMGYNTLGWDFLFYALVGVVITVSVRIAGVVVVFTFLIIPATLSAVFVTDWASRLLVAWMVSGVSAALGLLFAERFDFSVGPAIAMFLGGVLVLVGLFRLARVRRVTTAVVCLVLAGVAGGWLSSGSAARHSGSAGTAPDAGSLTHSHSIGEISSLHQSEDKVAAGDEHDPALVASLTDIARLESMYEDAVDVESRSIVVCRALEVNVPSGAQMAVDFLEEDPPLLFRLTVVEKLEEVTGRGFPYDIDQPFAAQSNQEAVAGLSNATGLR